MNDQLLHQALNQVGSRYRRLILRRVFAFLWLALAIIGLALLGWARGIVPGVVPGTVTLVVAMIAIAIGPSVALSLRRLRNPRWIARRIEQQFPDLDTRLLAALEQKSDGEGLGFLQMTVIDEALRHAKHNGWEAALGFQGTQVAPGGAGSVRHAAAFWRRGRVAGHGPEPATDHMAAESRRAAARAGHSGEDRPGRCQHRAGHAAPGARISASRKLAIGRPAHFARRPTAEFSRWR